MFNYFSIFFRDKKRSTVVPDPYAALDFTAKRNAVDSGASLHKSSLISRIFNQGAMRSRHEHLPILMTSERKNEMKMLHLMALQDEANEHYFRMEKKYTEILDVLKSTFVNHRIDKVSFERKNKLEQNLIEIAYLNRALARLAQGNYSDAINDYTELLTLETTSERFALSQRSIAYVQARRFSEAAADDDKLLRSIHPYCTLYLKPLDVDSQFDHLDSYILDGSYLFYISPAGRCITVDGFNMRHFMSTMSILRAGSDKQVLIFTPEEMNYLLPGKRGKQPHQVAQILPSILHPSLAESTSEKHRDTRAVYSVAPLESQSEKTPTRHSSANIVDPSHFAILTSLSSQDDDDSLDKKLSSVSLRRPPVVVREPTPLFFRRAPLIPERPSDPDCKESLQIEYLT